MEYVGIRVSLVVSREVDPCWMLLVEGGKILTVTPVLMRDFLPLPQSMMTRDDTGTIVETAWGPEAEPAR